MENEEILDALGRALEEVRQKAMYMGPAIIKEIKVDPSFIEMSFAYDNNRDVTYITERHWI